MSPSQDHEVPLEMFRNNPGLAPQLLRLVFDMKVPDGPANLGSENANEVRSPREYQTDGTVILGDPESPSLAVVIENQLRYDADKEYSWPHYLATIRSRQRCDTVLLVLCPSARVAARCRAPIETGHPGYVLRPLVLCPTDIPPITDPDLAREAPELATLSTYAHGRSLNDRDVIASFAEAMNAELPARTRILYYDFAISVMSAPVRELLEAMMVKAGSYPYVSDFAHKNRALGKVEGRAEGRVEGRVEGKAEGRVEGRAEGEAKLVLRALERRGIPVSDAARERVLTCTDLDQIERWFDLAMDAETTDDLFT